MSSDDETYMASESEEEEEEDDINLNNYSDDSVMNGYDSVEEDRVLTENFNHLFETHDTFESRDVAIEWLRTIGDAHFMYLVRSTTKNHITYVKCFRGNKHRITPTKVGSIPRESPGSSRINCPFQLAVELNKGTRRWKVRTMGDQHGRHNHEFGDNREGYRWPSAIKQVEYEMIREHTEIGLTPVQILGELKKQKEVRNYSNKQHIYNARQKLKREKMGEIPPLAFLFELLLKNGWHERHERIEGTNQIGDLFFADTRSLSLLEQFSEVILIDATYKTNIWKLPLVEVIGFVPTGQNFHIGFAFIRDEKEVRYAWVMKCIDDLLLDFPKPRLFITDRELALMNAIRKRFPRAKNLLCRRHIATDVHKYLTKIVKSKGMQDVLSECWSSIVFAQTEAEYESAVGNFDEAFEKYPRFVNYVKKTWLSKHRERFVACWVDELLHFGAVTTNRVESAQAQLKNELHSTQDDFVAVWEAINRVVSRQLDSVKEGFEKARRKIIKYAQEGTVFCRLGGKVAPFGIRLMFEEIRDKNTRGNGICDCRLVRSHGLLCKCKIMSAHHANTPVDPIDVADFWKCLHMNAKDRPSEEERRAGARQLLDEAVTMFKNRRSEVDMRKLAAELRKQAHPECEVFDNPPTPPRKGRPPKASGARIKSLWETGYKKVKKAFAANGNRDGKRAANGDTNIDPAWYDIPLFVLRHCPRELRAFLLGYHNVLGDGQCGFRALSWLLFAGDENRYVEIRLMLQAEMTANYHFWFAHVEFNNPGWYGVIWERLNYHLQGGCPPAYYCGVYDMMQIAAQRFWKVIVVVSRGQSLTFLPLIHVYSETDVIQPTVPPIPEVWYIGHNDEGAGHFYALNLPSDGPKPALHPEWMRTCSPHLRAWAWQLNIYDDQLTLCLSRL